MKLRFLKRVAFLNLSGSTLYQPVVVTQHPTHPSEAATLFYLNTVSNTLTTTLTNIINNQYVSHYNQQYNNLLNIVNNSTISVGSIIMYPNNKDSQTPNNFLVCNGSIISNQPPYHNLYNSIGNYFNNQHRITLDYTSHASIGLGNPHRNQNEFAVDSYINQMNTLNSYVDNLLGTLVVVDYEVASLGGGLLIIGGNSLNTNNANKTTASNLYTSARNIIVFYDISYNLTRLQPITSGLYIIPYSTSRPIVFFTKNVFHVVGGVLFNNSTTPTSSVLTRVEIPYISHTNFNPTPQSIPFFMDNNTEVVVTKNKVYFLGGITDFNNTTPISNIREASVLPSGSISSIVNSALSLPIPLRKSKAFNLRNKVFVTGGFTSSNSFNRNIYFCTINSSGNLSNFNIYQSNFLPDISSSSILDFNCLSTRNFVVFSYLLTNRTIRNYICPVNGDSIGEPLYMTVLGPITSDTILEGKITLMGLKNTIMVIYSLILMTSSNNYSITSGYYSLPSSIQSPTDYRSFIDGSINSYLGNSISSFSYSYDGFYYNGFSLPYISDENPDVQYLIRY
ncbi:MAG: hypothetical protein QXF12_04790 [Candidatus Aenigmatarchaeota archaeon]